MLKLTKLLFYTSAHHVFINNIAPTPDQRKILVQAKNDIRDHLRLGIARATVTLLQMPRQVTRSSRAGTTTPSCCIPSNCDG